jgi:hypothetical protein
MIHSDRLLFIQQAMFHKPTGGQEIRQAYKLGCCCRIKKKTRNIVAGSSELPLFLSD